MKSKILTCLLLLVVNVCPLSADVIRQSLHEGWQFRQARLSNWYPARVPGVVHTDLMACGLIDDPFFRLNERGVQWVDKEDWIYETYFKPDEEVFAKRNVRIVFEGLDTYADVFLNDAKIISADNMFRQWTADVRPLLRQGKNKLQVYFHSPVKIDMPKWEALPFHYRNSNDQSENGGLLDRAISIFARKAGYHYGWDWGPRLVTSGIWRPVRLEAWNDVHIEHIHIRQREVSARMASLTDEVEIVADRPLNDVTISVMNQTDKVVLANRHCSLRPGLNKISIDIKIRNPRLWWCNGLGKQNLYTLQTSVSAGDSVSDKGCERIGIRNVHVVTDYDKEGKMQFFFVLNGMPVFAKGCNYIPQDNFLPRVTEEDYRRTVNDAVNANMNMLRVWGGGIYENDVFYDLCDEMGLLVWQDFMFACSIYPATGKWMENVCYEAIDNVRRLHNHPCIALWCGGNECIDAWYNWGWKQEYEKNSRDHAARIEREQDSLYFVTLPGVVAHYAPEAFYWPSSPFTARGRGSDGVNGDRHYWDVWHQRAPIDSYNHDRAHFFSEYGFQSFPCFETVTRYAPQLADWNIYSEVMMSHQRGGLHANELIEWYLLNEYRQPKDFEAFLYVNQVLQADAMKTAIEAHRRDKPYCMGSILWQHNDCWPVASWSTRDYYGNWKAAHYAVKRAFEPLLISATNDKKDFRLTAVSDLQTNQKGTLRLTVMTLEGETVTELQMVIKIPTNTATQVWHTALSNLLKGRKAKDVVIHTSLSVGNRQYENDHFLVKQNELNYAKAHVRHVITPVPGGYRIRLSSDRFARAVCLSLRSTKENISGVHLPHHTWSDNYFNILPGHTVDCILQTDIPLSDVERLLQIRTLYDSVEI